MSNDTLDLEDFLDRVQDDKELLLELLDIFVSDFRVKRKELEDALINKNFESVEHIAHFLKGSCGNISAGSLRDIFFKLEKSGKDKILSDTDTYLKDIDENFEQLVSCIGEIRVKLQ